MYIYIYIYTIIITIINIINYNNDDYKHTNDNNKQSCTNKITKSIQTKKTCFNKGAAALHYY